jgi:hypothetical protein
MSPVILVTLWKMNGYVDYVFRPCDYRMNILKNHPGNEMVYWTTNGAQIAASAGETWEDAIEEFKEAHNNHVRHPYTLIVTRGETQHVAI